MHVLVIGSGLIGTATAWYLRREGADVTVVDRAAGPARETSFANAGMLTPSMADPWNAPGVVWKLLGWVGREDAPMLLRPREIPRLAGWGTRFLWNSRVASFERNMLKNLALASFSLDALRELRAELGLRYCERSFGVLKVFRDSASLAKAVTVAEQLAERGVVHRALDREGVAEVEPSLAPVAGQLAGGILHPDDESGDAHRFVCALAEAASGAGVRFEFDTAVTGLRAEGNRLTAVATTAGDLGVDACVLAAGSYSTPLLAGLGIRLPVRPVKGYSITVPFGDDSLAPRRPITDDALHIAVTPFGDRLRVAGTAEFTGLDHSVGEPRIRNLREMFETMFPRCAATVDPDADLSPWSGLRPMSVDGVPVLGATPLANLYLNTGHGHLGWTMAAGSGRAVARLVCGREPELPLRPYGLDRF